MTEAERDLWQEYLYYTRELRKFALADDLDMVQQLLQERERLQQEQFDPPRKEIYLEIENINREMTSYLAQKRNHMKRQNELCQAYDAFSQESVGRWMDNKR